MELLRQFLETIKTNFVAKAVRLRSTNKAHDAKTYLHVMCFRFAVCKTSFQMNENDSNYIRYLFVVSRLYAPVCQYLLWHPMRTKHTAKTQRETQSLKCDIDNEIRHRIIGGFIASSTSVRRFANCDICGCEVIFTVCCRCCVSLVWSIKYNERKYIIISSLSSHSPPHCDDDMDTIRIVLLLLLIDHHVYMCTSVSVAHYYYFSISRLKLGTFSNGCCCCHSTLAISYLRFGY